MQPSFDRIGEVLLQDRVNLVWMRKTKEAILHDHRPAFSAPMNLVETIFNRWGHFSRLGPEHLLAAVIGFYYGSRS